MTPYAVLTVVPNLTCAHLLVHYFWVISVAFHQVHDHSGFWLPLMPRALVHDYHHRCFMSCYGVLGNVDSLMRSKCGFEEYVSEKEADAKISTSAVTVEFKMGA
eukprot:CAMPEP_0113591892 /NCGR_PEP_ID=MMETSP0015_2-20120614/37531_1 /TAXON_ID=2838 /ORGANISM="Odontella" /LENGTH=103 /DNA_ID=CAMNT_0000498343 /DNA_START=1011 /DNA_END=1322 /DNA_ORIENTATION=- /assembly_acc=CAM_ASM_000160